ARGLHTCDDYSRVLDTDPHEYDLLLDALTINVTKCFRNLETWQALAPRLAALWAERHGHVRAWSAGCASGEEPYTLAIALAEAARQLGQESLLEHARGDAGARQGGDAVRTRPPAARPGGAAGADLPQACARMSAPAPPETIVKVAEWAAARTDGVIVTLGLGSCVAIMLHDPRAG